jgi:hypothetical protein
MLAYMGSRGIAPLILNSVDRCEWLPSRQGRFSSRRESLYPLSKRLRGLHSWSGSSGEEKNLLLLTGFQPRTVYLLQSRYKSYVTPAVCFLKKMEHRPYCERTYLNPNFSSELVLVSLEWTPPPSSRGYSEIALDISKIHISHSPVLNLFFTWARNQVDACNNHTSV